MQRFKLSAVILVMVAALMFVAAGCFGDSGYTSSSGNATPTMIKPQPRVELVTASTSGTEKAYYVTLAIKVKNNGAKGIVLVKASVTQDEETNEDQMEVFLKQGESHELEMTFPLIWEGGKFTTDVKAVVPEAQGSEDED
jgi:subtilase family serine protease